MEEFRYVAYNLVQGVVKGQIEARNEAEAQAEVTRLGYKPLLVRPGKAALTLEDLFPSLFRVSTGELVRFARHLASMLGSGGNLLRTVEMLQAETRNGAMKRILEAIHRTIDEGGSLSDALKEHPGLFNTLFVSVVEVGEYTGQLGPALEQLADILEKEQEAKQKAIRTLMYPMAIVGLSLVTMGVLMTVAIPPMLKVFERMGSDVPFVTRVTLWLFTKARENFFAIVIGAVALGVCLKLVRRVPRVRYLMDAAQTKIPVLGAVVVCGELSRFSRATSMLLDAGVSLATALRLGISGCKNQVIQRAFSEAEESLMSGHGLTEALKKHSVLPPLFVELVMIGEESNSLRRTMKDAANTYQKQLEQRLDSVLGMLEPASTLVVGGIVGLMAFSMFVPIYSGLNSFR